MNLVKQTILHGNARPGNCLAAAVATFVGKPLHQVPHFVELGEAGLDWWSLCIGYMGGCGYWPHQLSTPDGARADEVVFVAGLSPRGVMHQTLYKNGMLFHDPHPSGAGLVTIEEVIAWRPLDYDHTPGIESTDWESVEEPSALTYARTMAAMGDGIVVALHPKES